MNRLEVLIDAIANGGGTYLPVGDGLYDKEEIQFGYWVSRSGGIENLPNEALSVDILSHFENQEEYLYGGLQHLGLWRDESGKWSIDNTEWHYRLPYALLAGQANNQRAIFDIEAGEAIDVP